MDRGDLEPAIQQSGHDRRDLGIEQHQVAHHHRLAMHRREGDPSAQRQGRLDRDAIERDVQIGPRQPVAMDLAADGGGLAKGGIDLLPVDLGSAGGQGHQRGAEREQCERVFHGLLLDAPRMIGPRAALFRRCRLLRGGY